MQPDTTKIWTRAELRVAVGKILVESLGVDEAEVTDGAALARDLGAESIDFLDLSFKFQHAFGIDFPARLVQGRVIAWRSLAVLSKVLESRYGLAVTSEELRTIAPASVPAVLVHLETKRGLAREEGDERRLAILLAERLLGELDGLGMELGDVDREFLADHLLQNLHSPVPMEEVMNRFTVKALTNYVTGELDRVSRLSSET
jgi:acyl carrier protein